MSVVKFAKGLKVPVAVKGHTLGLLRILTVIHEEAPAMKVPKTIFITSINDGKHSPTSRHYTNEAVDIRSRNFPSEFAKQKFAARIGRRLGQMFYTVLEKKPEHFHIQVHDRTNEFVV